MTSPNTTIKQDISITSVRLAEWLREGKKPFILDVRPGDERQEWSSTVVMKIDLVGERNRGLAMGLNESAGYASVALVAFATGWVASEYGLRPYPFYIGIGLAGLGLAGSWLLIKDTIHHVRAESETSTVPRLNRLFAETTWKHTNLGSVTQAGLVTT